jgi:pyruvate kinase
MREGIRRARDGFMDRGTATAALVTGNAEEDPLYTRLLELRAEMLACESQFAEQAATLPESGRRSALNLVHYLVLRRGDLRDLQEELAERGLSSLGRAESHVMASLETVLDRLRPAPESASSSSSLFRSAPVPITRQESRALLGERAGALFGPPTVSRRVRIMVTAPDEAAERYELVRELLASGTNCMRINCAHGHRGVWEKIIGNLRRAEREEGRQCALLMDLPGPRARTGAVEPGPCVVKVKPQRDALGRVTRPAQVWLCAQERPAPPPAPAEAVLPLQAEFLTSLRTGDRLVFRDARDAKRTLLVAGLDEAGVWAHLDQTAYVVSGTRVRHQSSKGGRRPPRKTSLIGALPPIEQRLDLTLGDLLILTRRADLGRNAVRDSAGRVTAPARIPCVPPEVLDHVRAGEAIWFDDGRIGGRIESVGNDEAVIAITHAKPGGVHLAAEKGINLPDTDLRFPALMPEDLEILPFVHEHADLVGYSFVRTARGVEELVAHLDAFPGHRPGVLLKIETVRAFEQLPGILLAALRHPPAGVMIARGDLAVECGFARLAEVQEEILWLCEAAHIPVVWATQVLDGLAKTGRPSRAEVTDAAVAERAECVMLNKGPYIVDAVRALASIQERMQAHQEKKQSLLRELHVADRFLAGQSPTVPSGSLGGETR